MEASMGNGDDNGRQSRWAHTEIGSAPLYEMKGQRVHAYWQCIRLIPHTRFAQVPVERFVPAEMTSRLFCVKCNQTAMYVPGGNQAADHMKSKHPDLMTSFVEPSPNKKQRKKKRRKSSVSSQNGKNRRDLTVEERAKLKKIVAKWVARSMRPMTIVEDPELGELCEYFSELGSVNIELPGRMELREDIKQAAKELRAEVKALLSSACEFYCLTSDIWTDRGARSYISLTIHFIDAEFKSHSKLLSVAHFPGKHDGARIGAKLTEILDKWDLSKDKCVLLVRDGASNGVKGASVFGVDSMSCIAHSLQLVLAGGMIRSRKSPRVSAPQNGSPTRKASKRTPQKKSQKKPGSSSTPVSTNASASSPCATTHGIDSETDDDDGVEVDEADQEVLAQLREAMQTAVENNVEETASATSKSALRKLREVVAKFRRIATYFHRSPKAKHRLSRLMQPNTKVKGLILDCPTRWSSTHAMLARFLEVEDDLKEFFGYLEADEGQAEFSDAVLTTGPSAQDYFYIRCLDKLLEPFAKVTKRLGGEDYPTFVLVFPYLRAIKAVLSRTDLFQAEFNLESREPYARTVVEHMQQVRLALLELFSERFQGVPEELMWVPLLSPRFTNMRYLLQHERARAEDCLVEAMVKIEEAQPRRESPAPDICRRLLFTPPRNQRSVFDLLEEDMFGVNLGEASEQSTIDPSVDLEERCRVEASSYIRLASKIKDPGPPLTWWKDNGGGFPILKKLARKWLSCVATSVPSERAFSTGGNVVTVKRGSLKPSMVEDLIILAHNA